MTAADISERSEVERANGDEKKFTAEIGSGRMLVARLRSYQRSKNQKKRLLNKLHHINYSEKKLMYSQRDESLCFDKTIYIFKYS